MSTVDNLGPARLDRVRQRLPRPEEAAIMAVRERHGTQVPQPHDQLCGGHVGIDHPGLSEDWHIASVSHPRASSHHHDIGGHLLRQEASQQSPRRLRAEMGSA